MPYVIRLSREPAIPTYLADDGARYAASFEGRALHYPTRAAAKPDADLHGGFIEGCRCQWNHEPEK